MTNRLTACCTLATMAILLVWSAAGAGADSATKGTVDVITVHGASLEGNLTGDSPDRRVSVYLPPSYATAKSRRYPVVYMLHGFTDSDDRWFGRVQHFVNVPAAADSAIGTGPREMILVMPDAYTKFAGSMYSTSVVTGDWERFVAKDLVAFIDGRYRTIAYAASRGLAGHSMGGYGVMRIGMKHPDVFSVLYALSPCCMIPNADALRAPRLRPGESTVTADRIRTFAEIEKASFGVKAQLASAAAWSPNPKNPPLYVDLPVQNGEPNPTVLAKWSANAPLAMVDQYIGNLKKMNAIAVDAGDADEPIATTVRTLHGMLDAYGLAHTFEIYQGNHVDHIGERMTKSVLPFFASHLTFP